MPFSCLDPVKTLMYISEEMNLKKVKTKHLLKMSEDYGFISLHWK